MPLDVCPAGSDFQALPFMLGPAVSVDPLTWSSADAWQYARQALMKPNIPLLVLLGVVLATFVGFIVWRLARCVYIGCAQSKRERAHLAKVLHSRRLCFFKVTLVLFAVLAAAALALGMVKLPRTLVQDAWQQYDTIESFAANVSAGLSSVSRQVSDLQVPVDNLEVLLNTDINASALHADLEALAAFLDAAPPPAPAAADLRRLQAQLQQRLEPALARLRDLLAPRAGGGELELLSGALHDAGRLGQAQREAQAALTAYHDALAALPPTPPLSPAAGSSALSALSSAQEQLAISSWLEAADAAATALTHLQRVRAAAVNGTDPLARAAAMARELAAAAGEAAALLPPLAGALQALNTAAAGSGGSNATSALRDALQRLAHINGSVVQLPADAEQAYELANSTLAGLDSLYSPGSSVLALPDALRNASTRLVALAINISATLESADSGSAALAQLPDLQLLGSYVDSLRSQLQAVDAPSEAVGASLAAYKASEGSYEKLRVDAATAEPLVAAAASGVAAGAAAAADAVAGIAAGADSLAAQLPEQAAALAQLDVALGTLPDTRATLAALDAAASAFTLADGPRSAALDGARALLQRLQQAASGVLSGARREIAAAEAGMQTGQRAVDGVLRQMAEIQASAAPPAAAAQRYAYLALMLLYGATILWLLLLSFTTCRNCPMGTVVFGGLLLCPCLLLLLLLPPLYTGSLLLLRDSCSSLEQALVHKATSIGPGAGTVVTYYLTGQGDSLKGALRSAGLLDVDLLQGQVNSTVNAAMTNLTSSFTPKPQVAAFVADVRRRIHELLAAAEELLRSFGYDRVNPLYRETKAFACCAVPDDLFWQWVTTLAAGMLGWLALVCSLAVLRQLDLADGRCCRCSCLRAQGDWGEDDGPGDSCEPQLSALGDTEALVLVDAAGDPGRRKVDGHGGGDGGGGMRGGGQQAPPWTRYAMYLGGVHNASPPPGATASARGCAALQEAGTYDWCESPGPRSPLSQPPVQRTHTRKPDGL